MNRYKIVREDFWEDGKIVSARFFVKKWKKILFGAHQGWFAVTKTECYESGSYKTAVNFSTQKEAEAFVESLISGNPVEGHVETDVKIYQ
jgi:hypothetical protein